MSDASTPYAGLTPDAVLDALQAVGLYGDGRLLTLNSYENRVFQVHLEDGRVVVVKFYRAHRWSNAQILEEHQFARELADAEVPVVAPWTLHSETPECQVLGEPGTLALHRGWRFAVTPRQGGRSPELEDPQVLVRIGRFLARLHTVGASHPFVHRLRLGVEHTGVKARDWLLAHDCISGDQREVWRNAADRALDLAQAMFDRVGECAIIRVHGDCHVGNVLWTEEGPHFVDLDDACMAPAVQDLWMMLSGSSADMQAQWRALLTGYEDVADFDDRQWRLIEPLRTLRMLHYSAWLAQRWQDPAFPAAFAWFGSPSYWSEQTHRLQQQIEFMS